MTHTFDSDVSLYYWMLWPTVCHRIDLVAIKSCSKYLCYILSVEKIIISEFQASKSPNCKSLEISSSLPRLDLVNLTSHENSNRGQENY